MKILHIISSPRGEDSYSIKLANSVIQNLLLTYPESEVVVRDLARSPFPHLEEVHLRSCATPENERTPEQIAAVKHSDDAIAEIRAADFIVIGVPMYNFSIPSTLKTWIDHIARAGVTFQYTEYGPEGLIKDKKVYLAISTGGIYSGALAANDFTEPYLRMVLGWLGMTEVTTFRAEGTSLTGRGERSLIDALKAVDEAFYVDMEN